jgi:RNA polymerase sigma-70 factor, ECF subfamily
LSSITFNLPGSEAEAFAALYREFYPRVLGLCRYLLGSRDDAEDASSEVFLRLPKAMQRYDRNLPFGRWLSTVTGHYCLDLLRRRKVERRRFQHTDTKRPLPTNSASSPLDALIASEEEAKVRAAIARLPERYRAPLVLRYYHSLSYGEISDTLGLSQGTVKTRIFRAKKELQKALMREKLGGARLPHHDGSLPRAAFVTRT